MSDRVFKVTVLLLIALLVIFVYFASQNGRYEFVEDALGEASFTVLDTRTGTLHMWTTETDKLSVNPVTGRVVGERKGGDQLEDVKDER